jgi:hypothetical protein
MGFYSGTCELVFGGSGLLLGAGVLAGNCEITFTPTAPGFNLGTPARFVGLLGAREYLSGLVGLRPKE